MSTNHVHQNLSFSNKLTNYTFSHNGSINVNKSLLLALDFNTSAPPALPNIISPASFDAFVATLRIDDRVSSDGNSTVVEWLDDDDDAILSLVVDNVRDDVTDVATFVVDGCCIVVAKVILLKDDADEEPTFLGLQLLTKFDDECG